MGNKICFKCGKRYNELEKCDCGIARKEINEYKKEYYQNNKDIQGFLSSTRWRKLRQVILRRDSFLCQRCLYKFNEVNPYDLQVHHIKPRSKYPELMYSEDNLICICGRCNKQLGTQEYLDFEQHKKEIEYNL